MHRHRTSRFRALHPGLGPSRWQRLQQRSGIVLLVMAGLITAALLYLAPRYYLSDQYSKAQQAYSDAHWADFEAVERHWKSLPILQTVRRGDEPDVRQFLASQPLVVALLDRFEGRHLWVRDGDRLVPSPDPALTQQYLGWMAHAEMAQRFEWNPPRQQDPDFGKVGTVVLLSDHWLVIKRWHPGSPEVERALAIAFGGRRPLRLGLIREADLERRDLVPQPWGAEPNLQADPQRLAANALSAAIKTNAFGEGWCICGVAFDDEQAAYRSHVRRQRWGVTGVAGFVGLALALGLWLRHRARRKAMLDADRMASMTHSLKTPLAILKFRCDSIRLGRLSPERADEELLKIGEEVDHLTTIIETGLRVIRGGGASGPRGLATPAWIAEVVEDLRPAFELEGRTLDLRLGEASGRAPLPSLRSALLTLVENALTHGEGKVTVETWRVRRRLCLQVTNEGRGLEPHQLKALGKPFQRLRTQGKEGFLREGQGLGLSLLVQVAQQEGWGLTFASGPEEGFAATLEIPAA
ncbi:sensor histidine kinase [Geothrix oryzisoli]|uniref:sensor histidine kinase n=1 Tax=Geothrix oryzisoli TaxID=2922721 RepID=UPI001FACB7C0|nr:HAMP domain-containing sensor histidine kinase [Geothrix oryzisoli]